MKHKPRQMCSHRARLSLSNVDISNFNTIGAAMRNWRFHLRLLYTTYVIVSLGVGQVFYSSTTITQLVLCMHCSRSLLYCMTILGEYVFVCFAVKFTLFDKIILDKRLHKMASARKKLKFDTNSRPWAMLQAEFAYSR